MALLCVAVWWTITVSDSGNIIMPSQLSTLKHEALSLPEQERAELAKDLLISLDGPADAEVRKAWDVEICRRINEIESGAAELLDAGEVLLKVKQRLNMN